MNRNAFARMLLAAFALAAGGAVHAQGRVYRCTGADGRTSYQPEPCEGAARQGEVKLEAAPPVEAPRESAWKGYTPQKEAFFGFYYDPAELPVGYSNEALEAAIRTAAQTWSSGCKVRIAYLGRAKTELPGTPERVPVRWEPAYMGARHPAGNAGIAGTGSTAAGIQLKPRFNPAHMQSVMTHEMGHVLGLGHRHEEPDSIMSYLRDEMTRTTAQPSAADFLACNIQMRIRFGIEIERPPGVRAPRSTMSDSEAIERMKAKREAEFDRTKASTR